MSERLFISILIVAIQFMLYLDIRKIFAYKNGIVLETSLVESNYEQDEDLKNIVRKTKKKALYILLISLFIGVGLMFIPSKLSMDIISMYFVLFVDLVGIIIITQYGIDEFRKAYYKKNKETYESAKFIDFTLANQKKRFGIKRWLFVVPILIYIASIVRYYFSTQVYGAGFIGILTISNLMQDTLMDWYIRRYFVFAYTDKHAKNEQLNRVIIGKMTKKNYCKSVINALITLIYSITLWKFEYDQHLIFVYLVVVLLTNSWMIFQFTESGKKELREIQYPSQAYQDRYWYAWGYFNPNDKRLFVSDRKKTSLVINFARPASKIIMLVITVLMLLPIFFALPSPTKMEFDKDSLKISSYGYHDTLNKMDIKEIKILNDLPDGTIIRTNGVGTDTRAVGSFNIQSHGRVRLYLYSSSNKVIELKTDNVPIYLNDETDQKTNIMYQKIYKWLQEK